MVCENTMIKTFSKTRILPYRRGWVEAVGIRMDLYVGIRTSCVGLYVRISILCFDRGVQMCIMLVVSFCLDVMPAHCSCHSQYVTHIHCPNAISYV